MNLMSVPSLLHEPTRPIPDPWRRDELAEYNFIANIRGPDTMALSVNDLHEGVIDVEVTAPERQLDIFPCPTSPPAWYHNIVSSFYVSEKTSYFYSALIHTWIPVVVVC